MGSTMNRFLLRRLCALELRFPESPPDLSDVPMRDLEALERHYERLLVRTDISGGHESELPARLRRILRSVESEQSTLSRKSGIMAA